MDSQGESEEWKKVWNSYKDKDPWNIGNKQSQEAPKELKDRCVALLKEKVSGESDDIYSQFVLYCSRDKAVKDALKERGFSLASQNNNDTFWQGRFDKYKAASSDKKIPNITIESGDNHSTNGNLDKLKKGCLDAFNKPITEASYMNVLNNIKEWCSAEFKANE
ncbi:hypothetical protein HF1_08620 [Mycoplasma haemofelis str. Langford 1]|uniref:Uncharacterized protein n=2 Tax=Mycoplasma haemofelis TaxID=29501 RepID=F6FJ00_MYCHI|nr:hypothetical protein [Mycoplasma haemofelis]AEG73198.1 hypothetical protein MHF_0941 [Mycoplasma haemofelis Ohio2]CBY92870.1 hypothetical protein HF1_08620 [Mycoplasma haemofelis str. Langford 1]